MYTSCSVLGSRNGSSQFLSLEKPVLCGKGSVVVALALPRLEGSREIHGAETGDHRH